MDSYKERILKSIDDSEMGLTTVDVAKKAGISKTTVIKYLSVLRSEGVVEFAEVGPAKLWRLKKPANNAESIHVHEEVRDKFDAMPVVDIDFCDGDDKTFYFSFKVRPDQICALMKQAKKCICH
jgi:DNA-binding IscR family transcriptional regulator